MKRVSFGLFADCQYAEKKKVGKRYYKKAAKKLQACIHVFNNSNLEFIINLGDLIDEGFHSFQKALDIVSQFNGKTWHLVGNHDYNVEDHEKEKVLEALNVTHPYSSFSMENWRFVIIDGTEISIYRYPTISQEHVFAREYHSKRAPDSPEWNGAVSKKQLEWLTNELADAQIAEENVIIFSHFPIYPDDPHNLWNARDLAFIQDFDCVKAFISGHKHGGNYAIWDGKHYLCLRAMVDTKNQNSFCIVDVHDDKLVLKGFGRQEGLILDIK